MWSLTTASIEGVDETSFARLHQTVSDEEVRAVGVLGATRAAEAVTDLSAPTRSRSAAAITPAGSSRARCDRLRQPGGAVSQSEAAAAGMGPESRPG